MTNTTMLKEIIKEKGIKYIVIANLLDMSPYTLRSRINNNTEFTVTEVVELTKILNLDKKTREQIFMKG